MKKNKFIKGAAGCIILFLLLSLAACAFSGNEEKEKSNLISIMTWNMQALFDGEDNGNEYDEYLMSAGWSKEKYQGRISAFSKALSGMDPLPDIIALQELESELVISDLAASLSGYSWATHFSNSPNMSLGVGVISRFPVIETKSHSISINGDVPPRPVLEVRVDTGQLLNQKNTEKQKANAPNTEQNTPPDLQNEKSLVLFICHWKSKLGGEELTEETRRASARVILRRMRELAEQEPFLPIIVMGDLNENHDEFYRRNGEAICALLPDDPRSAELCGLYKLNECNAQLSAELQKDFFIISKNKPPQAKCFSGEPLVMYSPWANDLENGTYYYKNNWETIDHFLLSSQLFDEKAWDYHACIVLDNPPFASTVGKPMAYNPRTGYGLSDHLPLLLTLKWE